MRIYPLFLAKIYVTDCSLTMGPDYDHRRRGPIALRSASCRYRPPTSRVAKAEKLCAYSVYGTPILGLTFRPGKYVILRRAGLGGCVQRGPGHRAGRRAGLRATEILPGLFARPERDRCVVRGERPFALVYCGSRRCDHIFARGFRPMFERNSTPGRPRERTIGGVTPDA